MSTAIYLPSRFDINVIDVFTRQIVNESGLPAKNTVILDFSRLRFIDGSGMTVLTNTLEWLLANEAKIVFRNHDKLTDRPIKYLDDCGFFQRYLGIPLSKYSRPRNTTIPCTSVETAKAYSWIEYKFSPWFEDEMECGYDAVGSLRTCLKELFHNISDHSSQNTGFVHAQHFPVRHEIRITVSDFGVGIPVTMRSRFPDLQDGMCLLRATEEGVTAKSRPNNMGLGLSYLVETILANRGNVRIRSLRGNLWCAEERGRKRRISSNALGLYPGTLVEFSLDTRMFKGDDDERGQVEWL